MLFIIAEPAYCKRRRIGCQQQNIQQNQVRILALALIDHRAAVYSINLLVREFKAELDKIFVQNEEYSNFIITVMSFGFKYGIPRDSDIVQDVRFLPNPYYDLELREKTGNDKEIQDYVMNCKEGPEYLEKFIDLITFLIPNYIKEGKNQLVISIGCTGGKHRSVTIANAVYARLQKSKYTVRIVHRDILKDSIVKKL